MRLNAMVKLEGMRDLNIIISRKQSGRVGGEANH